MLRPTTKVHENQFDNKSTTCTASTFSCNHIQSVLGVHSVQSIGTEGMHLISSVGAEHDCTQFVFCWMSQAFSGRSFEDKFNLGHATQTESNALGTNTQQFTENESLCVLLNKIILIIRAKYP